MMKSTSRFASSAVRIAGSASLALLASVTVGCMAGPESGDEPEGVGEARSALIDSHQMSASSSTNTSGQNPIATFPNCVLSGLQGNFNQGQSPQWDVKSLFSEAGIRNGQLFAHGGAYTNINNERDWAGNTVGAKATCFDSQQTLAGSALWGGISANYSPTKIAGLAANRQCFLQSLEAADNTYGSSSSHVEVKKYTTTDAQHTTTGWYIEGNVNLAGAGYSGWPSATGVCYDFPEAQEFGSYTITSTSGQHATQGTFASAIAACGLTRIAGPFTNNSMTTGVWVDFNSSTGFWTLHAYGGQSGTAACID